MMNKFKNLSLLFLVVFMFFACSKDGKDNDKKKIKRSKTYSVQIEIAEYTDIVETLPLSGTIEAWEDVTIDSKINSTLKKVKLEEGSIVRKGDVILLFDDIELRQKHIEAKAEFEKSKALLEQNEKELNRNEELYKEGFVSLEFIESKRASLTVALSIKDKAKAMYEISKTNLSYARLKSPVNGVIASRFISLGENARTGNALLRIVQTNPLKVTVAFPETYLNIVKKGKEVNVKVSSFPDKIFISKIYFISPVIDEKSRTFLVKAKLDNSDLMLKPGQFAEVELVKGVKKKVIMVSEKALVRKDNIDRVFTLVNGKAKENLVKIGIRKEGLIEVIKGIKEGESVITDGAFYVEDNASVFVKGEENIKHEKPEVNSEEKSQIRKK